MILHQYIVVIIVFALLCFMARWGYLLIVNYFDKDKPVEYDIVLRKVSSYDKLKRQEGYDRNNVYIKLIERNIKDKKLAVVFKYYLIDYIGRDDLDNIHSFLEYRIKCGGCLYEFGGLYREIEFRLKYI